MGLEFNTFTKFYERLDRAHCEGKSGMMKILTEKGSDRILGAVAVGGPAGELVMTLTSGMHNGLGLSQIGSCVYPYPSWAEGIKHLSD
jgi:pyruvate/2-oxoglutarate dehydrogenase complex dihydrolipoamide dehydrogenase (E3) component